MEAGITAAPPGQLYLVIVTVPPDTSYVKSPHCSAKAPLGKTKANANMTKKNTITDNLDFLLFIISPFSILFLKTINLHQPTHRLIEVYLISLQKIIVIFPLMEMPPIFINFTLIINEVNRFLC
jgi:hypothetical protein